MKLNLLNHYRQLIFFVFHRFEGDNYRLMREHFAQIIINEVEDYLPLWNKKVLDVGGAKGEFCQALSEKRECRAVNLDPDPGDYLWPRTVVGFADKMPFANNEFDLVICRGVLEHIPGEKQQASVNEMYRVTKTGGICHLMIPPWYNPNAGHMFKPFHIFPFKIAKFLRYSIFGNKENASTPEEAGLYPHKINADSFEEAGLYPLTFKKTLQIISASGFKVISTKDAHLRLHLLTKIPLIREVAIPAVNFILRKE
jgi:SAM-dependent methyltransferase